MSTEALIYAIKEKDWLTARSLLKQDRNGQLIGYIDNWGSNCLHFACRRRAPLDVVELILSKSNKDTLMVCNIDGCAPLHEAILYCSDDITMMIIRACPSAASIANSVGRTPIEWAKEMNRSSEVIKTLEIAPLFEEYETKGSLALLSGSTSRAVKIYTRLLDYDPSNLVYNYARSTAYFLEGDYSSSLNDIEVCLDLNPNFAKAYSRKGAVFSGWKRYDDAIATYNEGLKKYPDDRDLLSGLDRVQKEKNEQDDKELKLKDMFDEKELKLKDMFHEKELKLKDMHREKELKLKDMHREKELKLKDMHREKELKLIEYIQMVWKNIDTESNIQEDKEIFERTLETEVEKICRETQYLKEENDKMGKILETMKFKEAATTTELENTREELTNIKEESLWRVEEVRRQAQQAQKAHESSAMTEIQNYKKELKSIREENEWRMEEVKRKAHDTRVSLETNKNREIETAKRNMEKVRQECQRQLDEFKRQSDESRNAQEATVSKLRHYLSVAKEEKATITAKWSDMQKRLIENEEKLKSIRNILSA